jgi:hypothetical protein
VNWHDINSFGILNSKAVYVASLKNVYVSPMHLGTVFSGNQQLLFHMMNKPINPLYPVLDDRVNKAIIIHKNTLATVHGPTLFYHTIIDRLPSGLLLKELVLKSSDVKLLINTNDVVPGYLFEYLSLLGIERDQLEIPSAGTIYDVDELYIATPFSMEPIPKRLLIRFRDVLLKASSDRAVYKKRNNNSIIIIQRKEADRRIVNINELIFLIHNVFKNKSHEILIFDADMSVADQIQMFNDAKMVIGVMASGLSNIIYCNQNTHIIDIRPDWHDSAPIIDCNGGREWCWWLSAALDLNYWPMPTRFTLVDSFVSCPLNSMELVLKEIEKLF